MSRSVALLVTGKARTYLRTSTALFCLSLCLIGTYLVLVESQYAQRQGDFADNPTVHLIQVTGPADPGQDNYLRFSDVAFIEGALGQEQPDVAHDTTVIYSLGFGIPDSEGESHFVYGLEGDGARLLGLPGLDDGVLYTMAEEPAAEVTLDIPVVEVEEGGSTSSSTVSRTFAARGGVPADNPLDILGQGDPAAIYVTGATFQTMVHDAFGVDWTAFRDQFDRENVFGSQIIKDVYVHVPSLDDVKPVAGTIADAGFSTNYTLKAFDDLAGSLGKSALLGLLTVAAAFLGCSLYVLLSLNSYFRVSHKDMAILRHAGFTPQHVARIYGTRVLQVFAVITATTAVYQVALAGWLLRGDALRYATLNLLLCGLLIALLCAFVVRVMVQRHTDLDVLTLLKADKEFE
jgi:hypothetical protein